MNSPIKLHLGCGKRNFGPDWIHIDQEKFSHISSYDIINLPVQDNSVDLIYASHVLEYFDKKEAVNVLEKWNNKLVNGGILRLAVPDFEAMAVLYVTQKLPLETFIGPLYGRMESDSKIIYHKNCYDFQSLSKILNDTGFTDIKKYKWQETEHSKIDDHSQAFIPHMDKKNGTLISLNVECIKK